MEEKQEQLQPSQEPSYRSFAEVDREYTVLATKAGDIQFRINQLQADLSSINERMHQLHEEGRASKVLETLESLRKNETQKTTSGAAPRHRS